MDLISTTLRVAFPKAVDAGAAHITTPLSRCIHLHLLGDIVSFISAAHYLEKVRVSDLPEIYTKATPALVNKI